ncbi:MAG: ABC transporter ATP-binding protein [Euryarchaeota archaeon]|nr:ABC transporter ATP-binding protein [Euryarchaeota archaeon]
MDIIKAEHLTKYYPPPRRGAFGLIDLIKDFRRPRETLPALADINLSIKEGEIFGLLGPNGAGKTTFCKIMNGLIIPTSGHIYIDGHESINDHEEVTKRMVTVFGGERAMWGLFSWRLPVENNLKYIAELWKVPPNRINERIEYALDVLDLEEKRTEWYQKLSAGMKQKVHLALAFIVQPKIIVLDEPTIRLDVQTKRNVHEVIKKELCHTLGSTILLTTHDMNEADKLCDRVAILNEKIAFIDRPENIKELSKEYEIMEVKTEKLSSDMKKKLSSCTIRIEDAYIDGTYKMKIFFEEKEKNLPKIFEILKDSKVQDLQIRTPSLEDAFVYLTEEGKNAQN